MRLLTFFLLLSIGVTACKAPTSPAPSSNDNRWLVPVGLVKDGGPGKDGIPVLEAPLFVPIDSIGYLKEEDLVLGLRVGTDIRAYPHNILNYHEIVNDLVGGEPLAVTYCPFTGTGVGISRDILGSVTTFGVSGLLYQTNLMPFDRETGSTWSQMLTQCVNGEHIGKGQKIIPMIETSWKTWKEMYPESRVLSAETGFNWDYDQYPYLDYRTDHDFFIFPPDSLDARLPYKERVHGIIHYQDVKVYRFSAFGDSVTVIADQFGGNHFVLAGSKDRNFIVSYDAELSGVGRLYFTAVNDGSVIIMHDQYGNQWDIFGRAVSGPQAGQELKPTKSFMGYWYGWGAVYSGTMIY